MAAVSFATQDGAGRSYSPDSYNRSTAAGARRMSPNINRRAVGAGLLAAGQKPGGYVPTYAKYARPMVMDAAGTPSFAGGTIGGLERMAQARREAANQPKPFLGGDFQQFQSAMTGAAKGYADLAGQDFKQQVGTLLGNLNGIGALRSGAVQAGVDEAMRTYGRQVGDYSNQLASEAANLAQGQYTYEQEAAERAREYEQNRADQQKAAKKSTIGKILGAAAGGIESVVPGGSFVGKLLGGIFG